MDWHHAHLHAHFKVLIDFRPEEMAVVCTKTVMCALPEIRGFVRLYGQRDFVSVDVPERGLAVPSETSIQIRPFRREQGIRCFEHRNGSRSKTSGRQVSPPLGFREQT